MAGPSRELDDYQLIGSPQPDYTRLRFSGLFQGREIEWICEFVTLRHEYRRLCAAADTRLEPLPCFIEIGNPSRGRAGIRVGLDIERIDTPAIRKMIAMIRNYRRLHIGRHEFGARYPAG